MTGRWTRGALSFGAIALIAAALAATAASRVDARGAAAATTVNVGFIYRKTGGPAAFGQEEYDGFQAGPAYTKRQCGRSTVNPTYIDDATDPATAITAFKSLVGRAPRSSRAPARRASALNWLAAQNNVCTSRRRGERRDHGLNKNTFAPGVRPWDVFDAANIFPPKSTGKKIVVFGGHAFGQGNYTAVNLVFGGKGHTVSKILSPFGAADVTPFAQLKNSGADARSCLGQRRTRLRCGVAAAAGRVEADDDRHGPREPRGYDAIGPLVQG